MKRSLGLTVGVLIALVGVAMAQEGSRKGGRHRDPAQLLKHLDTNGDGRISRDEWQRRPEAFDRLDKNHDGFVTSDELQSRGQHEGGHGRRALAEMDKNHDGQISRDEWTHNAEIFDRLDADHNGVLTREELRAHKHRRNEGDGSTQQPQRRPNGN